MEDLKIGEIEYRFMCIIWDNEPLNSGELVHKAEEELGWKKSTTYTTLKKLSQKQLIQNVDSTVTSLVPREKMQVYRSEKFVENTFGGSLPGFLVSFLGGKKLSAKEAENLKKIIDSFEEK